MPALLLCTLAAIFSYPDIFFLSIGLLAVGTKKRLNDVNLKISRGKKFFFTSFGVVVTVIAAAVAFLLFMGSISGAGNKDLLRSAGIVIALPVAVPVLIVSMYALFTPGVAEETEHGPAPIYPRQSK
ncbi:MAG: hypothetical protein OEM60_10730 [Gammaproteobacteria bacterium]|nr:hypothetical protein [Gammaproteobacteria bacterium]